MTSRFTNRREAGRRLAEALQHQVGSEENVVVLGLARGGVPVAYEVAKALHAPLDVLVVRKLGLPGHEEFAMGALASGGLTYLNRELIHQFGVSQSDLDQVVAREQQELERRERLYGAERVHPPLENQSVVIVDDGLATGATLRVAARAVRQRHPSRLLLAVPVGAPSNCRALAREADELICLLQPPFFEAVGQWYDDFSETSDEEVKSLLTAAAQVPSPGLDSSQKRK